MAEDPCDLPRLPGGSDADLAVPTLPSGVSEPVPDPSSAPASPDDGDDDDMASQAASTGDVAEKGAATEKGAADNADKKPKRRRTRGGKGRAKTSSRGTVLSKYAAQDPDQRRSQHMTKHLAKTKLCNFFAQDRCKYGAKCPFAHGESEIKKTPDFRKTRICKAFEKGECKDPDCDFAHGQDEVRPIPGRTKSLCVNFVRGECKEGETCRFAHEVEELHQFPVESSDDERGRRVSTAPTCAQCGSTIAVHLGIEACPVCRAPAPGPGYPQPAIAYPGYPPPGAYPAPGGYPAPAPGGYPAPGPGYPQPAGYPTAQPGYAPSGYPPHHGGMPPPVGYP